MGHTKIEGKVDYDVSKRDATVVDFPIGIRIKVY